MGQEGLRYSVLNVRREQSCRANDPEQRTLHGVSWYLRMQREQVWYRSVMLCYYQLSPLLS